MRLLISVLCLVGLVFSLPQHRREKRQLGLPVCSDPRKVASPCSNNPLRKGYFPYPGDDTRAIQCDNLGRMYIIFCPTNTVYNAATTSCVNPMTATQSPSVSGTASNPCTAANLAAGNLYFSVPNDQTKFIECDLQGHANILSCPGGLLWNESRLSCVYVFGNGRPTPTPAPTGSLVGVGSNPCRTANGCGTGFFSHPNPNKFIQCDLVCDAYVLTCPSGLVWNEYSKTCVSSYQVQVGSG